MSDYTSDVKEQHDNHMRDKNTPEIERQFERGRKALDCFRILKERFRCPGCDGCGIDEHWHCIDWLGKLIRDEQKGD